MRLMTRAEFLRGNVRLMTRAEQGPAYFQVYGTGQKDTTLMFSSDEQRMTAEELRAYAQRSRRIAASATNQGMARVMNELAKEYIERAERLDRQAAALQTSPSAPSEQQPMQQQQQVQPKKEDE